MVLAANISDSAGARILLSDDLKEVFPEMKLVWADNAYQGTLEDDIYKRLGWKIEIVRRRGGRVFVKDGQVPPPKKGFQLLKRRWVVERTIGWLSRCRRLAKDVEATTESSVAWLYIAMTSIMLKRMAT